MCYNISIKIIPAAPAEKAKKYFQMPGSPGKVKIKGEFPDFTVTDGHCGCSFVGKGGSSLKMADTFINDLLSADNVKRVNVIWYWTEFPKAPKTEKLSIREFRERNEKQALSKDVWFSISDPGKYERPSKI